MSFSFLTMEYRSGRVRCVVLLCVVFTVCGVIYLGYFCPEKVCALTSLRNQRQFNHKQIQHLYSRTAALERTSTNNDLVDGSNYVFESLHGKNSRNLPPSLSDDAMFDDGPASAATPWRVPYFSTEIKTEIQAEDESPPGSMEGQLNFPVKIVGVTFDDISLNSTKFAFDIKGRDVIVFLHIQKTGGTTFGRHLVHDLNLDKPCECKKKGKMRRKRCKCIKPFSNTDYWLFSRFSTGWQCGLHADWTELTSCVDSVLNKEEGGGRKQRRYYYITLLREPVVRFLSEYLHVQRGATWKRSRHWCGGHEATEEEVPPCYQGDTWEDVSLEDFLLCPSNLAINRQTRMLADLTLVGCYNASSLPQRQRDALMLASAKENLKRLAYFGLCEYQQVAQYVFEEVFRLHFLTTFQQFNETHVSSVFKDVTAEQLDRVRQLNHLDVELYEYAKRLMFQRLDRLKKLDPNFDTRFHDLAKQSSKTYQPEESDSN